MVNKALHVRMIALIVVFSFLSAALVGGVSTYMNTSTTKTDVLSSNQTIAKQISSEIERFMNDTKSLIETLALSPTAYSMDAAQVRQMILAAKQKHPYFETIYVMDTSGMQITKTTSTKLNNKADRDYFKEAVKGNTYITDSYISGLTNAPTITISAPIKNTTGQIMGVIAADISLKVLWEIAERTAIGQSGYVDIIDNKGALLAHPDKERVTKMENVATMPYVQNSINGQQGSGQYTATNGQEALIAYAPVEAYHWAVVTYLPTAEVNKQIHRTMAVMAILILIVVGCAAGTAFYFARGISRPIKQLASITEQLAGGDLSQKINLHGVEEVNLLAASLEKMRNDINGMIHNIMSSSERVAASSEQLTASVNQTAKSANLISSSVCDVAEGTDNQMQSIEKMVTSVQEMTQSIKEMINHLEQIASASTQSAEAAKKGGHAVNTAVSQMETINNVVNSSAKAVQQLGEQSKEIGQIVDTISNIAAQTNLLALNAAIEAARAGEQGRGFAVVAEEVRKLAEQSQEAAKKIAGLIADIQLDTERAVKAMNEGTREVNLGSEAVNNTGVIFREIITMIEQVYEKVMKTSSSAQNMANSSKSVETSINDVKQISQNIALQTQSISAATQEQSASTEEIAAASQSMAKMAEEMQSAVNHFKI